MTKTTASNSGASRLYRRVFYIAASVATCTICILACGVTTSFATSGSTFATLPYLANQVPESYYVKRPVREMHTKVVGFTVMRPVREKLSRQIAYTQMTVVREQHTKVDPKTGAEINYTVTKHVPEQREKTVDYTITRMVPEQMQKTVEYSTVRFETIEQTRR